MVKDIYSNTINQLSQKLNSSNTLKIALVSDTHLDDNLNQTISNISGLNRQVPLEGLVHLGDFLNGSLPYAVSKRVLAHQMEMFSDCGMDFYPVQGNHDGFFDALGSGDYNVTLNDDWYHATAFTQNDSKVVRQKPNPYYYVDFKKYNLRLIVLCTFFNVIKDGKTEKVYGTDDAQLAWFGSDALNVSSGTRILIASHDTPFENFENPTVNNPRYNGTQLMELIKSMQRKHGFEFIAWLCGHYHGDFVGNVNGLRFVIIGSQTSYVPQLWSMPKGGYYPQRVPGSVSEDLWDVLSFDFDNKTLYFYRFGAGVDREICWDEQGFLQ